MRKKLIGLGAAIVALGFLPAVAQDTKQSAAPTAQCAKGSEMQCGMAQRMGDMQKRMGQMRETMEQCARGEKHCQRDQMMGGMKDMHDRMGEMMKYMNAMPDAQKPGTSAKPGTEDHSHQHDKPK